MTDTVDVQATPVDPLDDKIMTLQFSVKDINGIINALNMPNQTPVVLLANIIAAIQNQCAPQIEAINNESQTTA